MANIGWGITGAGGFLFETFEAMEKLSERHKIASYLSDAGERTVHIYGLWDRLVNICPGEYGQEIVLESEQGASSPLSGRFQRGRHRTLIISPASANTVSKIVTGIADTLVTNAFAQAVKGKTPVLIVPTDQRSKRTSELPHLVHRNVCRKKLERQGKCQIIDVCPYNAFNIVEGFPKIDLTECEGCGICLEKCPYGAISFREEIEVNPREIDLKNVEKLKEFENTIVLESPQDIHGALEEVLNHLDV